MAKSVKTPLAALGAAFLATSVIPMASAEVNPFAATQLNSGYDLANFDHHEGKCGEGKCGEKRAQHEGTCGGAKNAEGKCGEKSAEGKCGEKKADKEGKCGEKKAQPEGKCGGKK